MRSFPLQIVTADGMVFDGQAESISVRAAGGDMSVQAGHCDYVTVLGMGQAREPGMRPALAGCCRWRRSW